MRRSTRDAIALADEILRRYRLHRRRQRPSRRARAGQQPSQPCLAMTLFDLGKAFDLLVRAEPMRGRLLDNWLKTLRLNSSWKSCTEGFATF